MRTNTILQVSGLKEEFYKNIWTIYFYLIPFFTVRQDFDELLQMEMSAIQSSAEKFIVVIFAYLYL